MPAWMLPPWRGCCRFWSVDYVAAWQNLQTALATKYDGMAIIRGMSQTAGAYATDEPFVPLRTVAAVSSNPADGTVNQIAQLQMGGYHDTGEMLTLRAAIADYSQWSTTPLDYTMNSFHLFDSGNELYGGSFTLAVLQQALRDRSRVWVGYVDSHGATASRLAAGVTIFLPRVPSAQRCRASRRHRAASAARSHPRAP